MSTWLGAYFSGAWWPMVNVFFSKKAIKLTKTQSNYNYSLQSSS